MAMAVNCLVQEARRKFVSESIFVRTRRSRRPQQRSRVVRPSFRANRARPGASGSATWQRIESIPSGVGSQSDEAELCRGVEAVTCRYGMTIIPFREASAQHSAPSLLCEKTASHRGWCWCTRESPTQ